MAKRKAENHEEPEVEQTPKARKTTKPSKEGWLAQRKATGRAPKDESTLPVKHVKSGVAVGGAIARESKKEDPKTRLHTHSRPKFDRAGSLKKEALG